MADEERERATEPTLAPEREREDAGAAQAPRQRLYARVAEGIRVVWLTIIALLVPVTMIFVNSKKSEQTCSGISTNVHHEGRDVLITDKGLLRLVKERKPDLIGMRMDQINFDELEHSIEQSPIVRRCEAYPCANGKVRVEIYQRQPIMRVFNGNGSYYMDAEGYKITASSRMRTHMVVVNGHVNSMVDNRSLIRLCRFINDESFWKSMIEQIYVTASHEFILVPRVGNHVVEFGGADEIERKFKDLELLYKSGWSKREWNVYNKVSVKYKGQIVCTKRS